MDPLAVSFDSESAPHAPSDVFKRGPPKLQLEAHKFFASVNQGEEKPFDFLQTLFDGVIAGGVAGVVVETALYPIDTIKTRLQVAQGGVKINLKGLYSGSCWCLAVRASAIFIGVYEPAKQKLLKMFP